MNESRLITRAAVGGAVVGALAGFEVSRFVGVGVSFSESGSKAWSSVVFTLYFMTLSAVFCSCLSASLVVKQGFLFPAVLGVCVLAAPLMFFAAFEGPLSGSGIFVILLAVVIGMGTYISIQQRRK